MARGSRHTVETALGAREVDGGMFLANAMRFGRILRRACHRPPWIDPLAARAGFEPATVGLRAALPRVGELVPAASVASLTELAERLEFL